MKLSARARHAVRLTLEVYRLGDGQKPVRLSEVSEVTGISRRFLEQLAMSLKSHEIIRGVCGRKGGYLLARRAEEITIGAVLRAVLGPIDLTICTADQAECMSSEFCECRLVWQLLKKRINELLDAYTIADITDRQCIEEIRKLLLVSPAVQPHEWRAATG